jgi:hypothetical protein
MKRIDHLEELSSRVDYIILNGVKVWVRLSWFRISVIVRLL